MSQRAIDARPKVTILLLFRCPHKGVEIKSRACLLPRASRLNSRQARAIFFREQL